MRMRFAVALVCVSAAAFAGDTAKANPPALPPERQVALLRAQLEAAQIDAAMKETALRFTLLQQQQAKAAAAVQQAVDAARKACGENHDFDLESMTCIERKEKK